MKPRVLLTGSTGQLGWELRRCLCGFADVVAPSRSECNLADADAVRRFVIATAPDLVVNPAAYTAVDRAEDEEAIALAVNATAVEALADAALQAGAAVIHYSTDYVFSGAGERPWHPDDEPKPLSAYGRSKRAGEQALVGSSVPFWIIRTSWLYAGRGHNFVLTMLRLLAERDVVRVVDDQVGAPTWVRSLAQATCAALLPAILRDGQVRQRVAATTGIYHLACGGQTSWHGLAAALRARLEQGGSRPLARLIPIASREYPTRAVRPLNSRLDCERFDRVFGVAMPDWEDALTLCWQEVAERSEWWPSRG